MSQHKDKIEPMIPPAQKAFAEINTRRSAAIEKLQKNVAEASSLCLGFSGWKPLPLCVVCPSQVSLWQDAGPALAEAMETLDPAAASRGIRFDPDCPTSASPLASSKRRASAKRC